jgi:hypothetical protein
MATAFWSFMQMLREKNGPRKFGFLTSTLRFRSIGGEKTAHAKKKKISTCSPHRTCRAESGGGGGRRVNSLPRDRMLQRLCAWRWGGEVAKVPEKTENSHEHLVTCYWSGHSNSRKLQLRSMRRALIIDKSPVVQRHGRLGPRSNTCEGKIKWNGLEAYVSNNV